METLSYCQLMERMLAAEARVVELESRTVLLERLPDRKFEDYIDGRFTNMDLAAAYNASQNICRGQVERDLSAYGIVVVWRRYD